jgi:hypothetical protein
MPGPGMEADENSFFSEECSQPVIESLVES